MELRDLTGKVGYIPGPVNIGVIRDGEKAVLVDTGLDKSAGKEIVRVMDEADLEVEAIINTHHHADHIGGNAYIKNRTGAETYAPELEAALIESPILKPMYLFSGASPPKDLRNRFLLAKPSKVEHVIGGNCISFDKVNVGVVPLPGHSPNQIGVEADGVLFCADAVFSMKVVEKYKLPFVQDVKGLKETLNALRGMEYSHYVPSHSRATDDIRRLAEENLAAIHRIEESILGILDEPKTTETVIAELCEASDLQIGRAQQYYLTHTLVMAYLGSMREEEKLDTSFKGNLLHWERK